MFLTQLLWERVGIRIQALAPFPQHSILRNQTGQFKADRNSRAFDNTSVQAFEAHGRCTSRFLAGC